MGNQWLPSVIDRLQNLNRLMPRQILLIFAAFFHFLSSYVSDRSMLFSLMPASTKYLIVFLRFTSPCQMLFSASWRTSIMLITFCALLNVIWPQHSRMCRFTSVYNVVLLYSVIFVQSIKKHSTGWWCMLIRAYISMIYPAACLLFYLYDIDSSIV